MTSFLENIQTDLIKWRREFHQYPESGFTEYMTTYLIGKKLTELGFDIYIGEQVMRASARPGVPSLNELALHEQEALAKGIDPSWLEKMRGGLTGLVAVLDTENVGKHIGFRFDIDGLPIEESEEEYHQPAADDYRSVMEHRMHACGHDGHIAIGLGVATYLAEHKAQLNGKFTLIFQPAEEGGRGAIAIVEKGWVDDIDEFYSGHIGIHSLPAGTIAASTKGFLASTKLNAYYEGTSSHAGMHPELGRNALLAGATAATNLHAIPRHNKGKTRINVGTMTAGNGRNIIPEQAKLELETRGQTKELNEYMEKEARRIIKAAGDLHAVKSIVDVVGVTEEMQCDDELIEVITAACHDAEYVKEVIPVVAVSGSEDCSFLMNRVQQNGGKATYMLFGTELEQPHHHPEFDFQEESLITAVEALIKVITAQNSTTEN